MRHSSPALPLPAQSSAQRHDWQTIKTLLPYLWTWKWRVIIALSCLICAKVANVAVPLVFKNLVDTLSIPKEQIWLAVPLGLLGAYGLLRFSSAMFQELRELVFARVTSVPCAPLRFRCSSTCMRCPCASLWSAKRAA